MRQSNVTQRQKKVNHITCRANLNRTKLTFNVDGDNN